MYFIAQVFAAIRFTWDADRYLLDPHTAVGVAAAKRLFAKPDSATEDKLAGSTGAAASPTNIGAEAAAKESLHRVCVMGCAAPAKVVQNENDEEAFAIITSVQCLTMSTCCVF